jgi:hypothetical protein
MTQVRVEAYTHEIQAVKGTKSAGVHILMRKKETSSFG